MFLVFGGEQFYASGGGDDCLGSFETPEEAAAFAEAAIGMVAECPEETWRIEWAHVVNGKTGSIVARFGELALGGGHPATRVRTDATRGKS